MRRVLYTILAKITRGIQFLLRHAGPVGRYVGKHIGTFMHAFSRKLVLISLKLGRYLKKYWHGYSAPFKDKVWIVLTSPWTLRGAVLLGIIAIVLPQTTLVAAAAQPLPQESLLYRLVGPGEEYFIEESVTEGAIVPGAEQAWRSGAVRQEVLDSGSAEQEIVPTDITSLALGGTALTKPNIIQGADIGEERKEVVTYTVQSGDVIGVIAEAFGVSVATILWENDLNVRSYIRPGDTIRILPVSGVRHSVKSGDTLSKIARKYDTTVNKIIDFNKLANASDISIGEQLILPGATKPRSAPVRTIPATRSTRLAKVVAPVPSINVPAGQLYVWPTTVNRVTQYFGWRHTGLDIAGPVGTPLVAARAGKVTRSRCGWNGGYGCHVILDHGDGVQTIYAHASTLYVDVGETVEQGQSLAAMGSTGRSTGSHIHFEVRVNGRRANPLQYVR